MGSRKHGSFTMAEHIRVTLSAHLRDGTLLDETTIFIPKGHSFIDFQTSNHAWPRTDGDVGMLIIGDVYQNYPETIEYVSDEKPPQG